MEKVPNRVGRIMVGANGSAAEEALRGEMEWSPFDERMAMLSYSVRLN